MGRLGTGGQAAVIHHAASNLRRTATSASARVSGGRGLPVKQAKASHADLDVGLINERPPSRWLGATVGEIRKHIRKALAEKLEFIERMKAGTPEEVTEDDVLKLFTFFKSSDTYLDVEVILLILRDIFPHVTDDELEGLQLLMEEHSEDGQLEYRQFHQIVSDGAGHQHIVEISQRAPITSGMSSGRASYSEAGIRVDRETLVDRLEWRVHRDEAFSTLPLTLLYMAIFMSLVILRLNIWERQRLERGLQDWIDGYGNKLDGPYLQDVKTPSHFFRWLEQSGMPSILGSMQHDSVTGYRSPLAVVHTLIGDVQLIQKRADNSAEKTWLLHRPAATSYLQSHPGKYLEAAIASIHELGKNTSRWMDDDIIDITLQFSTYSETDGYFALSKASTNFGKFGRARPFVASAAIFSNPYPTFAAFPLDVMFMLLLMYIMCSEIREMYHTGIHDLLSYWSIWNCVDWVSILLGMVNTAIWIACCLSINADRLQNLLDESAGTLQPNIMQISSSELDEVMDSLWMVRNLLIWLHVMVATNTVTIIMRFFKAFESNGRLSVVAKTFQSSMQDIIHFFIVFAVMFICMAIVAHILFGCDIVEFSQVGGALNTAGTVLMGDFGWYVQLQKGQDLLRSGTPRLFVIIWFVTYMGLVSMLMLNMLLAIILDRYAVVSSSPMARHEVTIWQQTINFSNRVRNTLGMVPQRVIIAKLQSSHRNQRIHPEETVTKQSLKDAFPNMKDRQAEYLMTWMREETLKKDVRECADPEIMRLKRTQHMLRNVQREVRSLSTHQSALIGRIEALENHVGTMQRANGGTMFGGSTWSYRMFQGVWR